jgi:N-formylmaleamate deformylase
MTTDPAGGSPKEIYAAAGLGRSLRRGVRPGVVVVDLQRGFTDRDMPLGSDVGEVLAATRRLLDAARELSVPVAFTAIMFEDDLRDAGVWIEKAPSLETLRRSSGMAAIDERLGQRPEEPTIFKRGPSAWHGAGFEGWIVQHEVDTVLLCGVTTSGCIRATAVDLLQASIPTLVVSQCVGDRAVEPHDAALFDLEAKYADVISLEAALAYLVAASTSAATKDAEPSGA